MKTFKLHLIRHGMTAGNLQGLYIGSGTDLPLCDEGRAQLADLKERSALIYIVTLTGHKIYYFIFAEFIKFA